MNTETVVSKLPAIIAEKYNDPDAIIRMRILSLDGKNRLAKIQVALLKSVGEKLEVAEHFTLENVLVTEYTMTWLTKKKPVYVDGKATNEFLTGYRKFLRHKEYDESLPLNALQFQCRNHSENYYANPFRISVRPKYDTATLQLVNMPSLTKREHEDPITGEVKVGFYYKRHKETKRILNLGKENYRRIEVR